MKDIISEYETDVVEYFKNKAADYDRVDEQVYWRLSDSILWHTFNEYILKNLPSNFSFLDAGGGTGRWSEKILTSYQSASGVICDLSEDMLLQAALKQKKIGVERLALLNGSIENMQDIPDNSFDLVFNFHNVIGFVSNYKKMISELTRVLKKGGTLVTLAPNYYHMIYFNISCGRFKEASNVLKNGRGTFVSGMPEMFVFTPRQLRDLYCDNNITISMITGFPITIYPGYLETQIEGSTSSLIDVLETKNGFDAIMEIEKRLITTGGDEIASRGNNIFISGVKK